MKFEWEKIHEKQNKGRFWFATYRAKVFGGWLVRNFDLTEDYDMMVTSESSVFVPDEHHQWTIEKEGT